MSAWGCPTPPTGQACLAPQVAGQQLPPASAPPVFPTRQSSCLNPTLPPLCASPCCSLPLSATLLTASCTPLLSCHCYNTNCM